MYVKTQRGAAAGVQGVEGHDPRTCGTVTRLIQLECCMQGILSCKRSGTGYKPLPPFALQDVKRGKAPWLGSTVLGLVTTKLLGSRIAPNLLRNMKSLRTNSPYGRRCYLLTELFVDVYRPQRSG
jgi:hypothetical protein